MKYNSLKIKQEDINLYLFINIIIREITQRFPTLTQLDFQPIGQPSLNPSIASAPGFGGTSGGVSTLPLPIKPNFFDQDNSRQASQDLLSKYAYI